MSTRTDYNRPFVNGNSCMHTCGLYCRCNFIHFDCYYLQLHYYLKKNSFIIKLTNLSFMLTFIIFERMCYVSLVCLWFMNLWFDIQFRSCKSLGKQWIKTGFVLFSNIIYHDRKMSKVFSICTVLSVTKKCRLNMNQIITLRTVKFRSTIFCPTLNETLIGFKTLIVNVLQDY